MALADIPDSQLARRARGHWNVDGIPILVGGVLYLGVVGSFIAFLALPGYADSFPKNWVFESFIQPLAAFALITSPFWIIAAIIWLSVNWEDVIEWFKLRLTYPRTGYVAPPSYWQNEPAKPANPDRGLSRWGSFSIWLVSIAGFTYLLPSPFWDAPLSRWIRTVLLGLLLAVGGLRFVQQKKPLSYWLSVLGDFWFGAALVTIMQSLPFWDLLSSRWVRVALLGVLLTIRGLRFGLYPEIPIVDGGRKPKTLMQVGRFLRCVLKSFWVWVLLIGLLPPLPTVVAGVWLGIALALILWTFLMLRPKVGRFQAACLCLSVPLCAFLLWRGNSASIAVALLIPGLCAVFVGGFRLYRYLHANPVRSI